jgi:hypothetical protein
MRVRFSLSFIFHASYQHTQRFSDICRFARDASTLRKVGSVLLATGVDGQGTPGDNITPEGERSGERKLKKWLVAKDAFDMCADASKAIYDSLSEDFSAVLDILGQPQEINVANVCFKWFLTCTLSSLRRLLLVTISHICGKQPTTYMHTSILT